jgi:hypothetical protein
VALEQRGETLDEAALPVGAFEPDVKVVDAGNGDHPDAAREQLVDDRVGDEVARRLHDDAHASGGAVFRVQRLDHAIGHALAYRAVQRFTAGQDDAARCFRRGGAGGRRVAFPVGHPLRKVRDDAREIALRLGDDGLEIAARVRAKPLLVAMAATAMAGPCHHVVDRFHRRRRDG